MHKLISICILSATLTGCALVTTPVKVVGAAATTTIKVGGTAAGAGIKAAVPDGD
jgi:hypothetical protein